MTKEDKIMILEDRVNKMAASQKNIKCPGALKKARRQLRNMMK